MSVSRRDVIRSLRQPKVAAMLMLGLSSGLPFFLTGNTLGYWMRDEGTALSAIGFLSWVGLAYSIKFLWAPIIDRVDAPVFGRLGRRRGWMVLTQVLVGVGLAAIAATGRRAGLGALGALALFVAFSSSTQDIVVDAWRIEAAADADELGLLSASYQFGYRIAVLISEAAILILASHFGWRLSYAVMAALMAVGVSASLIATEPLRARKAIALQAEAPLWTARGFFDAVVGPFTEFFRVYGWLALLMLAMISFYQLPDGWFDRADMQPVLSRPRETLEGCRQGRSAPRSALVATLVGTLPPGRVPGALRFGYFPTLIAGVVLKMLVIANFATLAHAGPNLTVSRARSLPPTTSGSALPAGRAGDMHVDFLTSIGYTATQYALLSSAYTYVGKFAKGFSGVMVERLAIGRPLIDAYGLFFISAALLGVPALILCIFLARAGRPAATEPAHATPP